MSRKIYKKIKKKVNKIKHLAGGGRGLPR